MNRPKSFQMNKLFAIMPRIKPADGPGPAEPDCQRQPPKKYKKKAIPRALKEQVRLQKAGPTFEIKCPITWCENRINAFNFHTGHNIAESKGGKTTLENLVPICDRCNTSMGDRYSIDDWNKLGPGQITIEDNIRHPWWICCSNTQ
jgi:hypothetical protein